MLENYFKLFISPKDSRLTLSDKILGILLTVLTLYLLILALWSLKWSIVHDSPIMLYASFLMNKFDFIPYKDFYDMNMPGIYIFDSVFIRIFGLSDLGFRIGDLLYLSAILAATWFWMRKYGKTIAWYSAVIFGIVYLSRGPTMSMQREFVLLFPIVLALCFSSLSVKIGSIPRYIIVGLLFGLATTIKPHASIGFPFIVTYMLVENNADAENKRKRILLYSRKILWALIGFAIPLAACLIYLIGTDALSSFLEIIDNYWPLYGSLTGSQATIWGLDKYLYLIRGYLYFGDFSLWFIPAVLAFYISMAGSELGKPQKRQSILLAVLTLIYGVYPVFAGKFWPYHWLIMLYFAILLSTLCLIDRPAVKSRFEKFLPIGLFFFMLVPGLRPSDDFQHNLIGYFVAGGNFRFMEDRRATEIGEFLKENLRKDDLVQPLDWTGGAVHGMLIAKAKIATPFIYDFYFYHHISNPYIQKLRKRLISDLTASRPRFIIQIITSKPWPQGYDTSHEFAALDSLLRRYYKPAFHGNGYTIFELKQ